MLLVLQGIRATNCHMLLLYDTVALGVLATVHCSSNIDTAGFWPVTAVTASYSLRSRRDLTLSVNNQ